MLGRIPGPSFDFHEDGHHSVMFLSLCYRSVRLFDAVSEASLSRIESTTGMGWSDSLVLYV
jgi:hypothetical protein